jgi:hypothetical protein
MKLFAKGVLVLGATALAMGLAFTGCKQVTDHTTAIVVGQQLMPPQNVKATAYPGANLITWDAVNNAAAYYVTRTDKKADGTVLATKDLYPSSCTTNTYCWDTVSDSNLLSADDRYTYTVYAVSASSSSGRIPSSETSQSGSAVQDSIGMTADLKLPADASGVQQTVDGSTNKITVPDQGTALGKVITLAKLPTTTAYTDNAGVQFVELTWTTTDPAPISWNIQELNGAAASATTPVVGTSRPSLTVSGNGPVGTTYHAYMPAIGGSTSFAFTTLWTGNATYATGTSKGVSYYLADTQYLNNTVALAALTVPNNSASLTQTTDTSGNVTGDKIVWQSVPGATDYDIYYIDDSTNGGYGTWATATHGAITTSPAGYSVVTVTDAQPANNVTRYYYIIAKSSTARGDSAITCNTSSYGSVYAYTSMSTNGAIDGYTMVPTASSTWTVYYQKGSTDGDGWVNYRSGSGSTSFSITGLTAGADYYVRISYQINGTGDVGYYTYSTKVTAASGL